MNIQEAFEFYQDLVTFGPVAVLRGMTEIVAAGTTQDADVLKFTLAENGIESTLILGTTDGGVAVHKEDAERARQILEGGMKSDQP